MTIHRGDRIAQIIVCPNCPSGMGRRSGTATNGKRRGMKVDLDTRVLNNNAETAPRSSGQTGPLPRAGPSSFRARLMRFWPQANLLRMRGEWSESTEEVYGPRSACRRTTRQHRACSATSTRTRADWTMPFSGTAWPLDVQPDSPADQIKLARLLDLKARDLTTPLLVKPQTAGTNPKHSSPHPISVALEP